MKYISALLVILLMFTAVGCYSTSSYITEGIIDIPDDIENPPTLEIPEFTVSVPSSSDLSEYPDAYEYLHFISTMEYILTENTWYEAESDGTQPADDPPTICFESDGTGIIWGNTGDGHTATEFTYDASENWIFTLTDLGNEMCEPLEDRWKEISVSMDMWFGTDEYILYITLSDGTVMKYYSETAERMADGSIKYSDGTISSSDARQ